MQESRDPKIAKSGVYRDPTVIMPPEGSFS